MNTPGVTRARDWKRGGLLTSTGEGEAREYCYTGTETGDAQVGG